MNFINIISLTSFSEGSISYSVNYELLLVHNHARLHLVLVSNILCGSGLKTLIVTDELQSANGHGFFIFYGLVESQILLDDGF